MKLCSSDNRYTKEPHHCAVCKLSQYNIKCKKYLKNSDLPIQSITSNKTSKQ